MEKYIKMLILSAQIEVLKELPHTSVYKIDSQLDNLKQKSAIMMDDLIKVLQQKRAELHALDGTDAIKKLKDINTDLNEQIDILKRNKF